MLKIDIDVSEAEQFTGVVEGVLSGVDSSTYMNNFSKHCSVELVKRFNIETIAFNKSSGALNHVFEWPSSRGEAGSVPLWRLDITGPKGNKVITPRFVQSRKYVPLPDANRYGIEPRKIDMLTRHIFRQKAFIMETGTPVKISPINSSGLFIPSINSPNGYVWSRRPVIVTNPGGNYAGRFTEWYFNWFASRAKSIIENDIAPVAQRGIIDVSIKEISTIIPGGNKRYKAGAAKQSIILDSNSRFGAVGG